MTKPIPMWLGDRQGQIFSSQSQFFFIFTLYSSSQIFCLVSFRKISSQNEAHLERYSTCAKSDRVCSFYVKLPV